MDFGKGEGGGANLGYFKKRGSSIGGALEGSIKKLVWNFKGLRGGGKIDTRGDDSTPPPPPPKSSVSNLEEQFQQKRLNYNTRRRQQSALETEEERMRKGPREKSATTSAKEKVTGRRRSGPRFDCFEANQKSCRIR